MPTSYLIQVTSFFEKDVRRQTKKDKRVLKVIEDLKEILAADPYNLTKRFDIKKLKGLKPGQGQFRIRLKDWRLRYDIFGQDVVLYSFRHRKDIYEV
jgi:mRNA-degrading endonuclease RelE of RelBE toxin-antitoxin system